MPLYSERMEKISSVLLMYAEYSFFITDVCVDNELEVQKHFYPPDSACSMYCVQRFSVTVQRGNAAAFWDQSGFGTQLSFVTLIIFLLGYFTSVYFLHFNLLSLLFACV